MMSSANNMNHYVREGIFLFDQKDFYASHEIFEDAWRETADESREFYRALLQISAGHFRLSQNRPAAAKKFFKKSLYWLKPFSQDHLGFKVTNLRSYLNQLINAIDQGMPSGAILEDNFQTLQSTLIKNKEDQMKILISGFEPFGAYAENPSMELVKALPDQLSNQISLCKTILPVDNVHGPDRLLEEIHHTKPDAVLAFGLAPKRHRINLERVAINLKDYRIPDNAGNQITDQPIIPGGPTAYFTTLPIRKMLTALTAANIPGTISLSAGAYLCNQVFYRMMHEITFNNWPIRAGFIHLPGYQPSGVPTEKFTFDFDMIIRTAEVLCEALID